MPRDPKRRYEWCSCHPAHRRRKIFGRLSHPGYYDLHLCKACYLYLRARLVERAKK